MRIRRLLVMAAFAIVLLAPGSARAIPAPMSPERLVATSDVVALVRVLAVACVGVVTDTRTGERLQRYAAWLQVVASKKGSREHDMIQVGWQEVPKESVGGWAVRYFPGEEVWTHLVWNAEAKAYGTTAWNAKEKPLREATKTKLPTRAGHVSFSWD